MSNNVFKKIVSTGVAMSTMLWSVGVTALLPVAASAATCPSYQPGDMVKVVGAPAIYAVNAEGKVLYFPNGDVFKSWNATEGYGGYTAITEECYDALPWPTNTAKTAVGFRAGSHVVKRASSSQLYVVLPGNVLAKISPASASALYGAGYAVKTLEDYAVPSYTMSATEVTGTMPHEGMLVSNGGKTWYVDAGNVLREVTAAGMTANRFKAAFVRPVASVAGFTTGETVAASAPTLSDRTASGVTPGNGTTTPVTGGALTVALGAGNPAAGSTIISDNTGDEYPQAMIPFTVVNFSAGSNATKVTQVKFTRTGIASDSDIGNLYLYDGDTRVAEMTSFSDKVATFSNSAGLFTVPAGSTKALTLKGDLAKSSTFVSAGKTIGFSIASASDVAADGTVGGSFPVSGNELRTAVVDDLGHVVVSSYTTYPSTVKADEANKELWRFTATASSQDMQVRNVKMTMVGTVATSDIKDLKLEVGGVQVGATQQLASDNTVTFALAAPVLITSGQSKVFVLRGSMNGGSGRTFKFTIQKSSDLVVFDADYGVFVTPNITNVTTAFSLVQPTTGTGTTVSSGTMTVGVATDSPTGNVADGATNVTLAKFNFSASGEAVKVDNLVVRCSDTGSDGVLANVKLMLDGSQVGSTASSLTCGDATSVTTTFGNTFVVPAGVTKYVTVVADTNGNGFASGDTLSVRLETGVSNATGQTTFTAINTSAQTARTLTLKSGTVTTALNSAFGNRSSSIPSGTTNAAGVKIASFVVTAGSGEAVDVTQFTLKNATTTQLGDDFQNLKMMNGSTQIGSTHSNLSTTAADTFAFTPASAIRLSNGEQYIVDVYADIKSSVTNSAVDLAPVVLLDSVTATGVNTGTDASDNDDVALQTAYISGTGTLTISEDGDSPAAGHLVMGQTDVTVAKFKLSASAAEALQVSELTVSNSTTATGTLKNVKLFVDGTQIGQTLNFSQTSGTSTYANAPFTGLNLTIPANGSKVVTVKADVTSYTEGATSASPHVLAILEDVGSGASSTVALGVSSGSSVAGPSADVATGDTMYVYRTGLSVAWASDSPSGSSVGSAAQTVAKVVVTNSSNVGNYDATVKNLNFAISNTGISNTATRAITVYKDSISSANQLDTSNYAIGATSFVTSGFAEGDFTDVTIAAGASKTFVVVLDTTDAGADDKLSIYVGENGVTWNDGVGSDITTVPGSLPLSPKTLSY